VYLSYHLVRPIARGLERKVRFEKTPSWREPDSNPRSRSERRAFSAGTRSNQGWAVSKIGDKRYEAAAHHPRVLLRCNRSRREQVQLDRQAH
jgi:hypothetical protein